MLPLVVKAHVWPTPVVKLRKVPLGASLAPESRLPQQTMAASERRAQVCSEAAPMLVKVPVGTASLFRVESPQQTMPPSVRSPQACSEPTATAVNVPLGGLVCPAVS
jgi:hypothetical protein